MRIAIDGRYISDHFPGIGRYTFNLVRALGELGSGDTFLVLHNPRQPSSRHPIEALARLPGVVLVEASVAPLSLAEQWRIPLLFHGLKVDVLHSPYPLRPYCVPCPTVITLHDLIPLRYPEYFALDKRLAFGLGVRLGATLASHIIAVSQTTADDLRHFLRVPAGKLRTIREGAEPSFCPQPSEIMKRALASWGLSPGYLLYLGSNKPHKNLVRLIEAYAHLKEAPPLVVAGHEDRRYPQARQRAAALGLEGRVLFLGDIPEERLPCLYGGAAAFVFPSLWEGFGLPVLEAMACGTPVACSRIPALQEVAGEAALSFDPQDLDEVAWVLRRLLTDAGLRWKLREAGLGRARTFSWEQAARRTLGVYREAAR